MNFEKIILCVCSFLESEVYMFGKKEKRTMDTFGNMYQVSVRKSTREREAASLNYTFTRSWPPYSRARDAFFSLFLSFVVERERERETHKRCKTTQQNSHLVPMHW